MYVSAVDNDKIVFYKIHKLNKYYYYLLLIEIVMGSIIYTVYFSISKK